MQDFPHRYTTTATGQPDGDVLLDDDGLPTLHTAPPAEFGGPGDKWSPETLLVASIADCLILTFRAIAKVAKLPWTDLTCTVDGTLDRVERETQFTDFQIHATLQVPAGVEKARAERLLFRAEHVCLITNSLKAGITFESTVEVMDSVA